MHILVAPNAFKNSLGAEAVAQAIEQGLLQSRLQCTCTLFPVGDGGDGTGELLQKRLGGVAIESAVADPLGRRINATYWLAEEGKTAVIEMANASGLRLLKKEELTPLQATSFGTGEQLRQALDKGVQKVILCMGGSATVDGGCGILQALGVRFLDARGRELSHLPEGLIHLAAVDLSRLDQRITRCELIVLCDVENKLLGERGAAAVFGPQKGATPEDVFKLERALARLATVASSQWQKDLAGVDYGGTAGGAAAGLSAFLGARLVNGAAYFLQASGFDQSLKDCDLLITGEGSLDEQTLGGKAPFAVAKRAKEKGVPVIGLAGSVPLEKSKELESYFDVLLSITHAPVDLATAMNDTTDNLKRTAREVGNVLALTPNGAH